MPARHRSSGHLSARIITALFVAVISTIALFVTTARDVSTAAPRRTAGRLIIQDNMSRSVRHGLGAAHPGGRFTVSSPKHTAVSRGRARFRAIKPGSAASATLRSVRARNIVTRVAVRTPRSISGGGVYFNILLRRTPTGDAYLAKVRVTAAHAVYIGLWRLRSGRQTLLARQVRAVSHLPVGRWLWVQARVADTQLSMRAWQARRTQPGRWQIVTVDRSRARIARKGAIGFKFYVSHSARSRASFAMDHLTVRTVPASTAPKPHPSAPSQPPSAITSPAPVQTRHEPGSAPLGTTTYPVPADAIVVAPTGSDSASGTLADPLRTLGRAIALAPSGATIVLRGGTYHESVTVPATKSLTVQAFPREVVWLDGSTVVRNWTKAGSTWVADGWDAQFDSTPAYSAGSASSAPNWSFVDPRYPMAAHPDQVWIDGQAMRQVGSRGEVTAGTFYVDYPAKQLVLGSNPAGTVVRASDLSLAYTVYSQDSVLRGIGVRRYATSIPQIGAVRIEGAHDTVENVVAVDNATTGLTVDRSDVTLRGVTAQRNGMLGIHAHHADDLVVTGALATENNTEHFNYAPVSGGMKVGGTRGVAVTDSEFSGNLGYGLWFDESCYAMTVSNNTISHDAAHGLAIEISAHGSVSDNLVTDNGEDGMKINDSSDLDVRDNTIAGNARQLEVVQDGRRGAHLSDPGHDSRRALPDPTEPWIIRNIDVVNNVFGRPAAGDYQLYVRDYSQEFSASDLNLTVNNNGFARPTSGAIIVWPVTKSSIQTYRTVAEFVAATGQGRANTEHG